MTCGTLVFPCFMMSTLADSADVALTLLLLVWRESPAPLPIHASLLSVQRLPSNCSYSTQQRHRESILDERSMESHRSHRTVSDFFFYAIFLITADNTRIVLERRRERTIDQQKGASNSRRKCIIASQATTAART
uniref:Putative secreted protein n=1 Tax=Anopheles darlingi TaxID=43151 RepID=A0A2M4DCQ1_ANODA